MAYFLIQTLIDALRGRPAGSRLLALRAGHDVPFICAVEEVERGVRPAEQTAWTCYWAPFGSPRWAGRRVPREDGVAGSLLKGVTLSQADCSIAGAADTVGSRLATGNPADFPKEELEVEHWPIGT
ncbi:MAG: type II toxin-antitoxin system VapC family toxin [Acidimicrobiia bacterium]